MNLGRTAKVLHRKRREVWHGHCTPENGNHQHFIRQRAHYEAEQKKLKERVTELQKELAKTREATANAEKFMNVIRKHTAFEELTPTLLREFVEKIVVHEATAADGRMHGNLRRQEIEIYYSFVGKVDLPE